MTEMRVPVAVAGEKAPVDVTRTVESAETALIELTADAPVLAKKPPEAVPLRPYT